MNADPRKHPYYHPYHYPGEDNARKRQRRQTAGAFMQSLFLFGRGSSNSNNSNSNNNNSSSNINKSTAKPRPVILVPPHATGRVRDLNPNDVLCGRGGRINSHAGNVQFRELVQLRKADYLAKTTKKLEKAHIAADIVYHIRRMVPSGRFLKEDLDGSWYEIGDQKAIKKVGQALREDTSGGRSPGNKKESSTGDDEGIGKKSKAQPNKPPSDKKEAKKTSSTPPPSDPIKPSSAAPVPAVTPSSSSSSRRRGIQHRPVTVSGRGAKKITTSMPTARPSSEPPYHQPVLVYQEIAPPPAYRGNTSLVSQDPPSPPEQFFGSRRAATSSSTTTPTRPFRSGGGGVSSNRSSSSGRTGGSASGATAAAMRQQQHPQYAPHSTHHFLHHHTTEEAFGRPFHPAGESSNSGSSNNAAKDATKSAPRRERKDSSILSGTSTISEISTSALMGHQHHRHQHQHQRHPPQQLHDHHSEHTSYQPYQLRQHQWAGMHRRHSSDPTNSPPSADRNRVSVDSMMSSAGAAPPMPITPHTPTLNASLQPRSAFDDHSPMMSPIGNPRSFATAPSAAEAHMERSASEPEISPFPVNRSLVATTSLDRSISMPDPFLTPRSSMLDDVEHPSLSGLDRAEVMPMPLSLRRNGRSRSSSSQQQQQLQQQPLLHGGPPQLYGSAFPPHYTEASSVHSGSESVPSMPGSILSDLSESLVALDLAEPARAKQD